MRYLLAAIAGVPIYLGLSPYGVWYLPIGSILLFAWLWRAPLTAKQGWLLGLAYHFGVFAAGANWLYISIHVHGQTPALLAGVFTGLFALFMAWMCSLPWILSPLFSNTNRLLAFPGIFLLTEWLRGWFFTGFPWLYLGQAHLETPLAGWVPVFGALGTGMAITATACAILCIFTHRKPSTVMVQSLLIVCIWAGGGLLEKTQWTAPAGEPISAILVQPNIALEDKWDKKLRQENMSILLSASAPYWTDEEPTSEENLIIWPEAALPYIGDSALEYLDALDKQISSSANTLITGYLTESQDSGRLQNAIGAVGNGNGEYLKQQLVPFGEYVPLENWLRGLINFFDLPMSVISPGGADQSPLQFTQRGETYGITPAICYEIAYPALVAKSAKETHLIVTLSNDAWFGDSVGPWQHMEIAQIRALENRKPVLRVTNNGVTASVDHRGRIIERLPQFEYRSLETQVIPMEGKTPFSSYRHIPTLIIALTLLVIAGIRSKIQSTSSK